MRNLKPPRKGFKTGKYPSTNSVNNYYKVHHHPYLSRDKINPNEHIPIDLPKKEIKQIVDNELEVYTVLDRNKQKQKALNTTKIEITQEERK